MFSWILITSMALKRLINSHKGILLIITHSRYLLNHCFNKIIHLENKELQEFDGRYIDYNFALLQQKIELQELAIADTLEIQRNAEIIDRLRFIATNNAEAARGKSLNARVKIQERLESRRIKAPFVEIRQPKISFDYPMQSEDTIALKVDNYSVSFDELILEKVTFEINSHEKVAIIGSNGTGKTTLLREIYTNNNPTIRIHESIRMAYLSQLQGEILNEANTLFDEFFELGFKTYQEIIDYLGDYGFPEVILHQTIGSLSGGEKNILQIAKLSASKANFLLFDEPTSHLDTYAQLALEKAMSEFNGGILMISHDFYSIVNCMDYVLIIEDKTIRKIRMRKFRKMIYESHFNKDYLELEQKKKSFETKIELALKDSDFEKAKLCSIELEQLLQLI
jgi:ATP-binding cassette, subfamily F, member 3